MNLSVSLRCQLLGSLGQRSLRILQDKVFLLKPPQGIESAKTLSYSLMEDVIFVPPLEVTMRIAEQNTISKKTKSPYLGALHSYSKPS